LIEWGFAIIRKFWSVRFFRFLVVGGINTLFGYLVYAGFILLNLHFSLAVLLSLILGIIFNFFTTGRIVFNNRKSSLIIRFFGVYAVYYLLNVSLLKLLMAQGFNSLVSGAITALPLAAVSYFLSRVFVFTQSNNAG
jgi:putative flippase GtrA